MIQEVFFADIWNKENVRFIDVRSEKEYAESTIPGAINIPLFTDQEREEVGKIYTKVSQKKAMEKGLEYASAKLPDIYRQISVLAEKNSIVLFCWRGGMRSKSVAVILDLMGLAVYRLAGGYKAYRKEIIRYFEGELPFHVVVLRGNTGVGKTKLLQDLKLRGYPVIDLEALSNNRGSVFGYIGLGEQPSQKQFDSLLYHRIRELDEYTYLIVECESKRIGKITLPQSLYNAMQEGTNILVYDTIENRIDRLVQEYTSVPETVEELKISLVRLTKRLGKKKIEDLVKLLQEKDFELFARSLIIDYYDPLYGYDDYQNDKYDFCISTKEYQQGLKSVESYLNDKFGCKI